MTKLTVPRSVRKTPVFNRYVIVWTTMGLFAAGYLSIATLAPDWLDDLTPAGIAIDPSTNHGQRANARLAAELNGVRDSIAQIQLDMSRIKTEISASAERDRSYAAQMSAVERRLDDIRPGQSVATSDPLATTPAETQSQANMQLNADPQAVTVPPTVVDRSPVVGTGAPTQPKVINADTSGGAPLVTGSVGSTSTPVATPRAAASATPPQKVATAGDTAISFGPAIVKPAPKPIGLQISKGASVDSLRLSWSLLAERHGDVLAALEPRYTVGGDAAEPSYDLVAGPVKTRADALKACKALTAKGVPCQVTAYGGNAL